MRLSAGARLGPYEILAPLGAGGMGEVWRALDSRVDRPVALKVLPGDFLEGEEQKARLEREARLLAALNHPNIAILYSFEEIPRSLSPSFSSGTTPGHILVMELLEGETLRERLREGPLPVGVAIDYGAQVAAGLAAAHGKGIVHRDLKPENVFVTQEGRIKILDFGVAKRAAGAVQADAQTEAILTEAGVVVGTAAYMSPEQVRGRPLDARSDVFSLGAVLYEMLAGTRPFEGRTRADLMAAILTRDPTPLADGRPGLPPDLVRIVARCLAKEPDERYPSARELAADLAALAGRPAGSGAQPTVPTVVPPAPAHRRLRRALVAGLPLLLAAGALAFWLAKPRPALSFAPRDWILVSDVQNDTGDPLFDRSLFTALTVSLEQSTHANVYPRSRVAGALKRMKKDPASRIDDELGREICQRENVRALVTCSIGRAGSRYVLAARLVDARTGESVRSFEEQAKGEDGVLPALSTLATHIRSSLGESLPAIQRTNRPLPYVTTSSLRALRQYAEGQYLWVKGNYHEAVKAFEGALAEDPEFAMALAALGNAYMSHIYNLPSQGQDCYEKALRLASRTTDRERQLIEASAAGARGNAEEAARLYRVYLTTYPDDVSVRYTLGTQLMQDRRYPEALEQLQEAVRIAPSNASAFINIATTLNGLHRYPEALATYEKAFALEPSWVTNGNLNLEYGMTFVKVGELSKARAVFEKALALPDMRSRGLRSLALLDLYTGHYRDAAPRLKEAILANEAAKISLSASRDRIFLAILLEGQGDRKGQLAELEKARALQEGLDAGVGWPASLGALFARAGSLAPAERLRERVAAKARPASGHDMADLHRLEGEIELARGRSEAALEKLRLADREFQSPMTLESLAHAALQGRNLPEAVTAYEALLAANALGWDAQQAWVTAPYPLALAYRASGQPDKARAAADRLLAQWKDADPDLVVLKKTRDLRRELER